MKFCLTILLLLAGFGVFAQIPTAPVNTAMPAVADTGIKIPAATEWASADSLDWVIDTTGSKIFTEGKVGFNTDNLPDYTDTIYANRLAAIQKQIPFPYNNDVRAFINMYVFNRRDQVQKMLGLSKIYFPIFDSIFNSYGVPTDLKYLSVIESALNPAAVSRCGATGMWQFMYGTGRLYGLNVNPYYDERSDIFRATEAAAQYLKNAYDIFGDWLLAIASYNSGAGWVQNAIARSGGSHDFFVISKYLPYETRSYVPIYIAAAYVMNFSEEHNLYPEYPSFNASGISLVPVNDKMSLDAICKHCDISMSDMKFLNPALKTNVVPASMNYVLKLPSDKLSNFMQHTDTIISDSRNATFYSYAENYLTGQRNVYYHTVRAGEGLYYIAAHYGITLYQLKAWNGLRSNSIYPGQRLVLYSYKPAANTSYAAAKKTSTPVAAQHTVAATQPHSTTATPHVVYYRVHAGDNLTSISHHYKGVTVASIKAQNGLRNNTMYPGQLLKIVMTP